MNNSKRRKQQKLEASIERLMSVASTIVGPPVDSHVTKHQRAVEAVAESLLGLKPNVVQARPSRAEALAYARATKFVRKA